MFVFQNTNIGWTDEGVHHELDEVFHLKGDGDATDAGALCGEAFGCCNDFVVFVLGEVVSFTSALNKPSIRVMQKIGLHTHAGDDFDNPKVPSGSPLSAHVLYRLKQSEYLSTR